MDLIELAQAAFGKEEAMKVMSEPVTDSENENYDTSDAGELGLSSDEVAAWNKKFAALEKKKVSKKGLKKEAPAKSKEVRISSKAGAKKASK
jgi:hypothetical protein